MTPTEGRATKKRKKKKGRTTTQQHPMFSDLLSDDDQGVSVFRQEVEDAPDLEGVIVTDLELILLQVLPIRQRPAHFVEVLTVKVILHLWHNRNIIRLCSTPKENSLLFQTLTFFKADVSNHRT